MHRKRSPRRPPASSGNSRDEMTANSLRDIRSVSQHLPVNSQPLRDLLAPHCEFTECRLQVLAAFRRSQLHLPQRFIIRQARRLNFASGDVATSSAARRQRLGPRRQGHRRPGPCPQVRRPKPGQGRPTAAPQPGNPSPKLNVKADEPQQFVAPQLKSPETRCSNQASANSCPMRSGVLAHGVSVWKTMMNLFFTI